MRPILSANHKGSAIGQAGYLTLVSVLVVGAVGVSVVVSVLLLSVGATQSSITVIQADQATALADACAERALQSLRENPAYGSGDTYTLGNGSCEIVAIQGSGTTNRTLQTTGTVSTITKRVEVEIATIASPMEITSWQEVADF